LSLVNFIPTAHADAQHVVEQSSATTRKSPLFLSSTIPSVSPYHSQSIFSGGGTPPFANPLHWALAPSGDGFPAGQGFLRHLSTCSVGLTVSCPPTSTASRTDRRCMSVDLRHVIFDCSRHDSRLGQHCWEAEEADELGTTASLAL
jgi:hypothetical protein